MLQNSVLSNNDDKIDFLVSEIETANTKISMLQNHLQTLMDDRIQEKQRENNNGAIHNEIAHLTEENKQLKACLKKRTEEANSSII